MKCQRCYKIIADQGTDIEVIRRSMCHSSLVVHEPCVGKIKELRDCLLLPF